MIPFRELLQIAKALPKCGITEPKTGEASFIIDRKNNKVGSIHWSSGIITIFNDYEYSDEVINAIGKDKFTDRRPDFNTPKDEPVEISEDGIRLTDFGKQLYDTPRDPNPTLEADIKNSLNQS